MTDQKPLTPKILATAQVGPDAAVGYDLSAEVIKANAAYFAERRAKKYDEDRADFERVAKELATAIRRHGVWNVLSILPDMLRERADEEPEYSEAEDDYLFAVSILESAMAAVDLPYGERSSGRMRAEALAEAKKQMDEIKP